MYRSPGFCMQRCLKWTHENKNVFVDVNCVYATVGLRACPLMALLLDILVFCSDFSDSDTKIIPLVGRD
jgi:hypothetical protein